MFGMLPFLLTKAKIFDLIFLALSSHEWVSKPVRDYKLVRYQTQLKIS
jgi:hypothetical protein